MKMLPWKPLKRADHFNCFTMKSDSNTRKLKREKDWNVVSLVNGVTMKSNALPDLLILLQ